MTRTAAPPFTTQPAPPAPAPPALSPVELLRWAWRQLTSMRTALVLLMLLGLAAIPGSLIPQQRVDARAVSLWKSDHPRLTPLFEWAGMFHVYGSAWFSAIYILLMVSLVGCIVPRLRVYWRAFLAPPPAAPRNLMRLPSSATGHTSATPAEVAQAAAQTLRRQRFRLVIDRTPDDGSVTVCAQRGYLREAGNLLFHLSLVVVLVAFAAGDLLGYRGGVIIVSGQTFTNARQSYDDFAPGTFFRDTSLDPFSLQLDEFKATFLRTGPSIGQPTAFSADVTYRSKPGASDEKATLKVNHPLTVDDTSVFLVGNGYAPVITVRDGNGNVTYSGPTVFLPENTSYASWGVIKAPDAAPTQLGFEGEFLPTYGRDRAGRVVSRFPDALAPTLSLTAFTGDLGLESGVPQSVYALNKTSLTAVKGKDGKPLTLTIPMGETRQLPDGTGSITFDGVQRWAKLQLSSTPAEPLALGGVILGLIGLLGSLYVRPRRLWVRARPRDDGSDSDGDDDGDDDTVVEVGGLDRHGKRGLDVVVQQLTVDLTKAGR